MYRPGAAASHVQEEFAIIEDMHQARRGCSSGNRYARSYLIDLESTSVGLIGVDAGTRSIFVETLQHQLDAVSVLA
jgi:hypothetical protein